MLLKIKIKPIILLELNRIIPRLLNILKKVKKAININKVLLNILINNKIDKN